MKNRGLIGTIIGFIISFSILGVIAFKLIANKPRSVKIKTIVNKKPVLEKNNNLSERQNLIMAMFSKESELKMDDIATKIEGVHVRTLRRELSKLCELNLIEKIGTTRGSIYKIINS